MNFGEILDCIWNPLSLKQKLNEIGPKEDRDAFLKLSELFENCLKYNYESDAEALEKFENPLGSDISLYSELSLYSLGAVENKSSYQNKLLSLLKRPEILSDVDQILQCVFLYSVCSSAKEESLPGLPLP
ncbi:MAG TPA: hypothetical protein PLJ29_13905, partial [Leptospiraceae bacterium]|nr:hypothetical protein [Leptospiraceae bacterium]